MKSQQKYEEELAAKKAAHLKKIQDLKKTTFTPCQHDECPECCGTGKKLNGFACIHYLHCTCPKCSTSHLLMSK